MIRSSVSEWHQLEEDLARLYYRLVNLGMGHHNGQVYLADLEYLKTLSQMSLGNSRSLEVSNNVRDEIQL